jgi:hypothetical protein
MPTAFFLGTKCANAFEEQIQVWAARVRRFLFRFPSNTVARFRRSSTSGYCQSLKRGGMTNDPIETPAFVCEIKDLEARAADNASEAMRQRMEP